MFKESYIRWLAVELFKQLDRLDLNEKKDVLDKLIDIFTTRRAKLDKDSKDLSRYIVKPEYGHWAVYKDGKFVSSADTKEEAYRDVRNLED